MEDENKIIFVYGTLKRGYAANRYLSNSIFLGNAVTSRKYSIYSNYLYPAMIEENSERGVSGELYSVSPEDKIKTDEYEGVYFNLYELQQISVLSASLSEEFSYYVGDIESGAKPVFAYIYKGNLEEFIKIESWS